MLRFCGPFLFLGSIPAFYYGLGPAAPLLSVALLLTALTLAEVIAPRTDGPSGSDGAAPRLLALIYIPLQLAATLWGIFVVRQLDALGFIALTISLGVTMGVFGVLAAHEAVHGGKPFAGLLGTALLTGMSYRHFRIAHLHGHHRLAATEKDAATARLGESFYHFLPRTLIGQWREAWNFEHRRLESGRLGSGRSRINRVLLDMVLMLVLFAALAVFAGPRALAFFLCQSAVAILVLELFNYIAHYGLMRTQDAITGRLEAFGDRHSWNSSNVLANHLIFNMGRHAHHHLQPAAPYHRLVMRAGPELPFGYAGSILLALAPPLWRRVMDEKALGWRAA